tara:strand:- start:1285 stop:2136 length:852 start_codon:yes stop_codon:yes gene_type:complete
MVKIITIFDKHEDFIELQYNSIVKHIQGGYEYIVFNNASNQAQRNKNKMECDRLGISCIPITVNYNGNPSSIAGEALNAAFKHVPNKKVFKIDSDMFFTDNINLNNLFVNDLIYIPNYKPNKVIMWSGVFGINLDKVDLNLDFRPAVIPQTDTFGQSCLLTTDSNLTNKLITLYSLHNINDNKIITCLNNDNLMKFNDNLLFYNERPEYYDTASLKDLAFKYNDIINRLKKYDFPEPFMIDIITHDEVDFIIHFKSANWTNYDANYLVNKKTAMIKLLTNDNN